MSSMTKENGKAAMIIVFCKAVSPLTDSNITAIVDWMIPQMSFTLFGGVNDPFVDCMPSTKVAESAEVMKNEAIKKIAKTERMSDIGIVLNISKIVSSVNERSNRSVRLFWMSIAVVPKAENQNEPKKCRRDEYTDHKLPDCTAF